MADTTTPEGDSTPEVPTPPVGDPGELGDTSDGRPGDQEPETFDREYVQNLRDEAAANRVKAKRADDAEGRLRALAIEAAARGVLTDPSDLPWTDDMTDEEGWPDSEKIIAAATALAERKPHLGRPGGDVGQGRHSEQADGVSLVGLLRAGA